jgi:hypothetical protein
VNVNPSVRKKGFCKILSNIRFSCCSKDCVNTVVLSERVMWNEECMELASGANSAKGTLLSRQNIEKSSDFFVRVVYDGEDSTTFRYTSCLVDCGEPKWESRRLNLSLKDAIVVPVKNGVLCLLDTSALFVNLAARKVVVKSWAMNLNKDSTGIVDDGKLYVFDRFVTVDYLTRCIDDVTVKSVRLSDVRENQPIKWTGINNFSINHPSFYVVFDGSWVALNRAGVFTPFNLQSQESCRWSNQQRDDITIVAILNDSIYIIFKCGNFFLLILC